MIGKYHLGYKGVNREGLSYVIDYYKHNKDLFIKFDVDGVGLKTTGAYLTKGLPLHPTFNTPKAGDRFSCKDGDTVEILEYIDAAKVRIKWLSDGSESTRAIKDIRENINKHPTKGIPKVGEVYKMRKGYITILEYNSASDVVVQFDDGAITTTSSTLIRNLKVGHPTCYYKIGSEFVTNSGWKGTILEYLHNSKVLVRWQDGSETYESSGHIEKGSIKPLMQPSIAGVGYIGVGKYSDYRNSGEHAPKVIYEYWTRMLTRCYNEKEVIKESCKRYLYVEVCNDWFCFQNFAEWALSQPNWNMGHDLDKDLVGDSTEYSPSKCTFLPADVNVFLADSYARTIHDLPKGVQYLKPGVPNAKVGYIARCHTGTEREYLGYYDTPEQAFKVYKVAKEKYAKELAEKYKATITQQAYENLLKFEVTM